MRLLSLNRRAVWSGRILRVALYSIAVAAGLTTFLMVGLTAGLVVAAEKEGSPMSATEELAAAREVDRLLVEETGADSVRRAPLVDDETFLRRATLDLIGRTPTPEAVIAFSLDADEDKRAKAVRDLVDDPRFGENWARYWSDVILYRRTEERALLSAPALATFLADSINANRPWSETATAFITAAGDVRENGATGLIMAQAGQPEDVVAEISRIFLGIQIQCAQCHDHPTDRWKREQFHELAAFLPRVAVRPDRSGEMRSFLVVANDRPIKRKNENNRYVGTSEHHMPDLDDPTAEGKLMKPVFFVSGASLEMGAADAERRSKLAAWVTAKDNPWFAKAFVNRLWAEMAGEGFYEPVDDMGPDRAASAPMTLDYLSQSFADSGYDLKRMVRIIVATKAYQRQSQPRRNAEETPFLANCSQRLRGDQLYDALVTVLGKGVRFTAPTERRALAYARGPRGSFNATFGYDPSERKDELGGSMLQALAMMNSELVATGTAAKPESKLGQLLRKIPDNEAMVVELYLQALSRQPSQSELQTCLTYVNRLDDREEAFEDILWSLVNCTEFLHRK